MPTPRFEPGSLAFVAGHRVMSRSTHARKFNSWHCCSASKWARPETPTVAEQRWLATIGSPFKTKLFISRSDCRKDHSHWAATGHFWIKDFWQFFFGISKRPSGMIIYVMAQSVERYQHALLEGKHTTKHNTTENIRTTTFVFSA